MILPGAWALIQWRTATWLTRKTLVRLMLIMRPHCSSVISSKAALLKIPALLTRMSSRPNCATVPAIIASTSGRLTTSVAKVAVRTPCACPRSSHACAVSCTPARFRSESANQQPSSAKRKAMARPMPRAAPVITATLLRNRAIFFTPLLFLARSAALRRNAEWTLRVPSPLPQAND